MPIYREEYDLAVNEGVKALLERMRKSKTKPHYVRDRKNLGLS